MTKHLLVLFFCLFLVMIGFGITLPVFAFYAERLARAGGASEGQAAVHVGLLTGIYALMQFLFAPFWGRWSDRIGRKPLVLIGVAGYAMPKRCSDWQTPCGCFMARGSSAASSPLHCSRPQRLMSPI